MAHSTRSLRASGWAKTLLRQRLGYGGAELRLQPKRSLSGMRRSKFRQRRIADGILVHGSHRFNLTGQLKHAPSYSSTALIEPTIPGPFPSLSLLAVLRLICRRICSLLDRDGRL